MNRKQTEPHPSVREDGQDLIAKSRLKSGSIRGLLQKQNRLKSVKIRKISSPD